MRQDPDSIDPMHREHESYHAHIEEQEVEAELRVYTRVGPYTEQVSQIDADFFYTYGDELVYQYRGQDHPNAPEQLDVTFTSELEDGDASLSTILNEMAEIANLQQHMSEQPSEIQLQAVPEKDICQLRMTRSYTDVALHEALDIIRKETGINVEQYYTEALSTDSDAGRA